MDRKIIARELAENIRSNTQLRHRLGMEEGTGSGVIHESDDDTPVEDVSTIFIDTADGQTFALGITEVTGA